MTKAELERENKILRKIIEEVRECTTKEFRDRLLINKKANNLHDANSFTIGYISGLADKEQIKSRLLYEKFKD